MTVGRPDGDRATLLVVRHAYAGHRAEWQGDDARRPLWPHGEEQAARLVAQLATFPIERILTSPADRCIQTIAPLAAARGIAWESHRDLAVDATAERVCALLATLADGHTVICGHGEQIGALLGRLRRTGVDLGPRPQWEKASTWSLELVAGGVTRATYLEPPA